MPKHSPEPWKVAHSPQHSKHMVDARGWKDMERIVACVNACMDIPTEELHKMTGKGKTVMQCLLLLDHERIVACVNACMDIPTEELHKMTGKGKTVMQCLLLLDPETNTEMEILSEITNGNVDDLPDGECTLTFLVGHNGKPKWRHTFIMEEVDEDGR